MKYYVEVEGAVTVKDMVDRYEVKKTAPQEDPHRHELH